MAGEGFHLAKLSAPALLVIIFFFHLLMLFSLSTSQNPSFANGESLPTRDETTGVSLHTHTSLSGEECDLSTGEWIRDPSGSLPYTNASCSWISDKQNCLKNGRPDTEYMRWRWKPFGCDLPRIDAATFLNAMRNKSVLYIGESVTRNQMESMLCFLSQVEEAVMVYHDKRWQSKRYYFPLHDFTFGRVWSPFLVASTQKWSYVDMKITLDYLDETWTKQFHRYDYVYFTGGAWFEKEITVWENHTVIGCHNCNAKKDLQHLELDYAYRKALRLTYDFMAKSDHKPLVIYRSWVPTHYEEDPAIEEKYCNRTQPFKEGEYTIARADPIMREVEAEEMEEGIRKGARVKHLDIYHLSLLRPDGHPGPYQYFQPDISKPQPNDCLHWCLPGVPDTWNQLLMGIILEEEEKSISSSVS